MARRKNVTYRLVASFSIAALNRESQEFTSDPQIDVNNWQRAGKNFTTFTWLRTGGEIMEVALLQSDLNLAEKACLPRNMITGPCLF